MAAHRHAAGKKDIVKGLFQQGLVFRPTALHHRDPVVGQTGGDEFLQGVGAGRGVGRGFQDRAVARRDGSDEGLQGELDGVVPGSHDEYHSIGLRMADGAGGN